MPELSTIAVQVAANPTFQARVLYLLLKHAREQVIANTGDMAARVAGATAIATDAGKLHRVCVLILAAPAIIAVASPSDGGDSISDALIEADIGQHLPAWSLAVGVSP